MRYSDIKVGTGPLPQKGHLVVVSYVGKLTSGYVFDRNDQFRFRIGTQDVIKGMDIGVASMRVGGIRRIVIPPALGYGARGAGKDIPPNSTLIFDVELLVTK